jgi:hypothetical protein
MHGLCQKWSDGGFREEGVITPLINNRVPSWLLSQIRLVQRTGFLPDFTVSFFINDVRS